MKYTVKDFLENANHTEDGLDDFYEIENHRVALLTIWSYGGGRNPNLVSVWVDGKCLAARCKRDYALRKAIEAINAE